MKTRILVIVALTIAALCLLLGLRIGRTKTYEEALERPALEDSLTIKRVYNLIILDESGSMEGLQEVSVSGVNEALQTIRNAYEEFPQQEQFVTFATFSGEPRRDGKTCRVRRELQNITEVKDLALSEYNPNGLTPLWDTMGRLLTELEPKVSEGELVLVTIITDGCENSSIKYGSEEIRQLVTRLDEKGWTFTYIGANQDAALAARNMGIKNSYQYSSDYEGTRNMFEKERSSRRNYYRRSRTSTTNKSLREGYFEEDDKE